MNMTEENKPVVKEESRDQSEDNNTSKSSSKLVVVLVRGLVGIKKPIRDTLKMLRLTSKNTCVVVVNNPVYLGMLKKCKDYATWGDIDEETFKKLVSKRGKEFLGREKDSKGKYTYKFMEYEGKKYKPYFTLNPPLKGFGRKGIKLSFKLGGALGNRGDKMKDLILRML